MTLRVCIFEKYSFFSPILYGVEFFFHIFGKLGSGKKINIKGLVQYFIRCRGGGGNAGVFSPYPVGIVSIRAW